MNLKKIIISFITVYGLCFTNKVYSQDRFQYLTVEFGVQYNDSTIIVVDTAGIDNVLQDELRTIIPKKILNNNEIRFFNELGQLGWELIMIDDNQNFIIPGHRKGTYVLTHTSGKSTKYYFKIKVK